jgi:hypothetical protein
MKRDMFINLSCDGSVSRNEHTVIGSAKTMPQELLDRFQLDCVLDTSVTMQDYCKIISK